MVEPRQFGEAPIEVVVAAAQHTDDQDDDGDAGAEPRSSSSTTAMPFRFLARLAIDGVTECPQSALVGECSSFGVRVSL
jgi:hypothetical protein